MKSPKAEDFVRPGTTDTSFADRLDRLHDVHAPDCEIDAAVMTFERLKTSIAICDTLFEGKYEQTTVAAVLTAMTAEAHNGTRSTLRE